MVTLVPPGAAVALADAVSDAVSEADAEAEAELEASELAELDDDDDLSPDEQPDRPAMTIAAPPTATRNPRFTGVLLLYARAVKIGGSSPVLSRARQPGSGDCPKNSAVDRLPARQKLASARRNPGY